MHTLHKEISDLIDDHDHLTCNIVAEHIGCTKQRVSDFLKNGGIGFRKLLRLSYLLFPSKQQKVMTEWCLRLNTTESIKQSFEYASITRNKELLKKLIELHKKDKSLCKYVAIYSILYKFYTNEIQAKDLIVELNDVGQLKDELSILSEIIKCYNYYYQGKHHLMLETAQSAEEMLSNLSDRHLFIKECYFHRISEVLGNVSLLLNDLEATEFYASAIINANMCAKTVSDAYYLLGMTFLTVDKHQCIKHLQTRYEISQTLGEVDIEQNARRDLDFAKIYLDIKLDYTSDPILVKLQSNKGSEFELKLIKEAVFQQGEDDFLILLGAIAKKSVTKLHECHKGFFSQSNYFFASLSALEIKKAGEKSLLIEDIINFKIKTKGDVKFEKKFIKCFSRCRVNNGSITA